MINSAKRLVRNGLPTVGNRRRKKQTEEKRRKKRKRGEKKGRNQDRYLERQRLTLTISRAKRSTVGNVLINHTGDSC